jgi:hypothetical protein
MMGPEEEKPIVSLLADDPAERPRIEAFVLALSESVDGLQDLEQAGDFGRIGAHARALGLEAESNGFPALSEAGTAVVAAAAASDAKRTREAILELTEISRRVRLGHRGATPPGF